MLDEMDWRIIRELQNDGRIKAKCLGEKLGVSHTTARERILRLLRSGIIKVRADVGISRLGLRAAFLRVEVGDLLSALRAVECLKRCNRTIMIGIATGDSNLILVTAGRDVAALMRFVEFVVKRLPAVRRVEVSVGEIVKPEYYPVDLTTPCPYTECAAFEEGLCLRGGDL